MNNDEKSQVVNLLDDVKEFLDNYVDVVDGDDGPRPNRAMSLTSEIDRVLAIINRRQPS
jgi:hypothetical protein